MGACLESSLSVESYAMEVLLSPIDIECDNHQRKPRKHGGATPVDEWILISLVGMVEP